MSDVLKTAGVTDWFVHDRFGMFIHWGIFALPARHEQVMANEKMTVEEYKKYFDHFDPDLYNPEEWADLAKEAGMKYFVITTKHHDGFCLWDSKYTDYKATNTPYGKDVLRPMVDAFRNNGLKVGLYHSLLDWHHPDYTLDWRHAQRNLSKADQEKFNAGRDMARYREYLHSQIKELLTEFGKLDIMWFDFSFNMLCDIYPGLPGRGKDDWDSEAILKMVRRYQPWLILDDRLDLEGSWDVKTPEQYQPTEWVTYKGQKVVWEACQTFSGSWGYHRDEDSWKDTKQLLFMLIDSVSKGGNLLLNVGPTGRGEIDNRAKERLKAMGDWMRYNSRSIYGCTQAPKEFKVDGNLITYNPTTNRLYIHLVNYPPIGSFLMDGFPERVEYAQFLHDHSEVVLNKHEFYGGGDQVITYDTKTVFTVPVKKPNVEIPVVEVFLKG